MIILVLYLFIAITLMLERRKICNSAVRPINFN